MIISLMMFSNQEDYDCNHQTYGPAYRGHLHVHPIYAGIENVQFLVHLLLLLPDVLKFGLDIPLEFSVIKFSLFQLYPPYLAIKDPTTNPAATP